MGCIEGVGCIGCSDKEALRHGNFQRLELSSMSIMLMM